MTIATAAKILGLNANRSLPELKRFARIAARGAVSSKARMAVIAILDA